MASLGEIHGHAVPGLQEKAASIKYEITTPLALPIELTAPKLHQEAVNHPCLDPFPL